MHAISQCNRKVSFVIDFVVLRKTYTVFGLLCLNMFLFSLLLSQKQTQVLLCFLIVS